MPEIERVSRAGAVWRGIALVAGALLVVWGTVFGNDLHWPVAPMAQFAFRVGENDSIRSTFLQARTADGDLVTVPLSSWAVGVGRAEVESQIPRMEQDPELLGALAVAYGRLHPGEPTLEQLWLREKVVPLRKGRAEPERVDELVTWTAPGAAAEPPPADVDTPWVTR